jgi:high-affinity iron transporter
MVGESIRAALFEAQHELLIGEAASTALSEAEAAYLEALAAPLQAADPAAGQRAGDGFAAMHAAQAVGNPAAFAAARAQTWTAILAGSYSIVEQAIAAGDISGAQAWLQLREFRTATRFTRPNGDATRALHDLAAGLLENESALQFLRADLYDTYQARLSEALRELETAQASGFAVRSTELAALAQGYFHILSSAHTEQRGAAATADAQAAFDSLLQASLSGSDLDTSLAQVHLALEGFRAAPLSPEEQARRAGQLLRYVNLVAVEYGRGVADGRVTLQFEIQEAATFQDAAQAAFADLRDLLQQIDSAATAQAATSLDALSGHVRAANTGGTVISAKDMRAEADALLETLDTLLPAEWKQASSGADFDVIDSMLDQMENAVRNGEYALAESARIEAYAIMESGPEARLIAMAPELKLRVEELFWNGNAELQGLGTLLSRLAPLADLRTTRVALDQELDEVETLLSAQSAPAALLSNAAVIVFREGLEAVLILASLMGSLKFGQNLRYRRPLWLGTILALLATVLTWTLARSVLIALARYGEKLEAIVSLIAIAVLLLITNWFFHKSYWEDWLAHFHSRKRSLLAGEAGVWLGLVSLGFTSVYREGFETVLFLQALVLDGGNALVMGGVAIGLACTLVIGIFAFRMQSRLPYKKMLVVTGIMIGAVLLVMVGKTVHVLQLVGWMPASLIPGISLPYWAGMWFGVYASWEGLALQLVAAVFVIGSYYLAEALKKRQPVVKDPQRAPAA